MNDTDPAGRPPLNDRPAPLTLAVSVDRRRSVAVVHAAGEVDLTTAEHLRETASSVLRDHPDVLVLDLSDVTFLDSTGLDVLVLLQLRAWPGTALRVVASARATLRPLEITALDTALAVYPTLVEALAVPLPPVAGEERRTRRPPGAAGLADERSDGLWRHVSHAAGNRVPATICAQTMCTTVLQLAPELESVTVTLRAAGATHVLAVSDPWAGHAEELHHTAGEGPGLTAHAEHRELLVPDLAATDQWPGFTHAASRIGVAAVLAFPLPDPLRAGTLTFYRSERGLPPESVLAAIRTLAWITATMLAQDDLIEELGHAPDDDVHIAAGMLSVRLHISVEDASARLRAAAFRHDTPLLILARAIIADPSLGRDLLED